MKLFVDTETTGKYCWGRRIDDIRQPYIVQLAAVLFDDNHRERSSFCTLIKPRGDSTEALEWEVSPDVEAIHGISTLDCLRYGLSISTALDVLGAIAVKATCVIAHNVDFDASVILTQFARENRKSPPAFERKNLYCTMKASTSHVRIPGNYGDFKWPKLSEAYRYFFHKDLSKAHDAMADVRACADIYFALQAREVANANH